MKKYAMEELNEIKMYESVRKNIYSEIASGQYDTLEDYLAKRGKNGKGHALQMGKTVETLHATSLQLPCVVLP